MTRAQALFAGLMATQMVHSTEEYLGRLHESFPPARFVSGLVSADHQRGFLIANVVLVAAGLACLFGPVRRQWSGAGAVMMAWAAIEVVNGIGHPLWAIWRRGYTPGVATAPILFVLAILLAREVRSGRPARPGRRTAGSPPGVGPSIT